MSNPNEPTLVPMITLPVENTSSKNGSLNIGSLLELGQNEFSYHFDNVTYSIKQSKSKSLKILKDTCGTFTSGRLTAIVGPSGAGKTSMLNVLSGFKASGVTGNFEFNNSTRNLLAFRKICSYIPQEFVMLSLLTTEETLKVSADLKLPAETTTIEKKRIIKDILQVLNMENCRHTLVRDLSGGERKRLSIGVELVTNPPVMFFDEPTSGLDSVASLQIIDYLRRLATDGRIIVCVVHQPSSRLLKLFDDILVMSRGEVLYSGPIADMILYFRHDNFVCPNYYNPVDFVLEVGTEEHTPNIQSLIQRNKDKHCYDILHSNNNPTAAEEHIETLLKKSDQTAVEINHNETVCQKTVQEAYNNDTGIIRPKEQVSVWRQFSVLLRRSTLSMSRNLISVQLRVIMHVVVAILLGIVFWNIGNDASKVLTNASCIFFLELFVFFGNAMPSILLCPQDTAVFLREYLNGWYSVKSYYFAKIIADIPMQLICPSLFISIIYFMTGQPHEFERFSMCWGICFYLAVIGHFIGLVFGSMFDVQMSIFLVPSITIPFLIFSGFFIHIHELSSFLRPLCDVSFLRYTIEGLMQAIYGYGRAELHCPTDFCYFKSPLKLLKEFDMSGDLYGNDTIALFLWVILLNILFLLSLKLRIKRAQ